MLVMEALGMLTLLWSAWKAMAVDIVAMLMKVAVMAAVTMGIALKVPVSMVPLFAVVVVAIAEEQATLGLLARTAMAAASSAAQVAASSSTSRRLGASEASSL